jgi:integrase
VVARKLAKLAAQRKIADAVDNSYPVLLRRYIEEHARPHTKRWRDTARMLGLTYPTDGSEPSELTGGLADRWAMKPVREITADDILIAVDDTIRTGVPGLNRRRAPHARAEALGRALHSKLGAFFAWLIRNRRLDINPCAAVAKPRPVKTRERVLSDEEIVSVWHGCEKLAPHAAMTKLLILTGGRLREVTGIRHSELAGDLSTWTLPKARAKNGREHRVPLAPLAREIIKGLRRIAGSDYVLTFTGERPVDGHSSVKQALDTASGVTGWTFHDLRRTVGSK